MKKFLSVLLAAIMLMSTLAVLSVSAADPAPAQRKVSVLGKTADGQFEEPDTKWYDDDPNATEFVIDTAGEFLGFIQVVNAQYENFKGATVKLDADIVINVGDASTWTAETTGLLSTNPIGMNHKSKPQLDTATATVTCDGTHFAGTFDGQGHVISGIYSVKDRDNALFGIVTGTVKNFAIVNSLFINTGDGRAFSAGCQGGAAVVDRLSGTIDNVFASAYIRHTGFASGGLVGYMQHKATITNSVFAGSIDLTYCESTGGGIYGANDYKNEGGLQKVENVAFIGEMIINKYKSDEATIVNNSSCANIGLIGAASTSIKLSNIYVDARISGDRDRNGLSVTGKLYVYSEQEGGVYSNDNVKYGTAASVTNIYAKKWGGNFDIAAIPDDPNTADKDESKPASTVLATGIYDGSKVGDVTIGYIDSVPTGYNRTISSTTLVEKENVTLADLPTFSNTVWANYGGSVVPTTVANMLTAIGDVDYSDETHPLWTPPVEDEGGDEGDNWSDDFNNDDFTADKKDEAATTAAPEETTEAKKGCKGAIATGAILVTVSALGLGAVVAKKKED